MKFGMIPEFVGRLPVITALRPLGEEELVKICLEPKNAIVRQYKKFFQMEGAELEIPDKVLRLLAKDALELGTGARGMRSILEEVMLDLLFELPDRDDVTSFVLTEEIVVSKSFVWPAKEPARTKKAGTRKATKRRKRREAS